MPGRKTHEKVGTISGAMYAAHRAKEQKSEHAIVETLGGALGGYVGGITPDVLEPGTSSWHRGACHSYTTVFVLLSYTAELLSDLEAICRERADSAVALIAHEQGEIYEAKVPDFFDKLIMFIAELFWRALAGFLNGLKAGYISHLVLDAGSSRSLPLLTKGF